jgi:AraC family transcriptional regulator
MRSTVKKAATDRTPKKTGGPARHYSRLFAGDFFVIGDFRCNGLDCGHEEEETAESYQIVVPRFGSFRLQGESGSYMAEPMSVLLLNRNERYTVTHPVAHEDRSTVISIRASLVLEILQNLNLFPSCESEMLFSSSRVHISARQFYLHRELFHMTTLPNADRMAIEEAAIALAASLLAIARATTGKSDRRMRASTNRAHRTLVEQVKRELAVGLGTSIALGELAYRVCSTPFHMCRVFRKVTGQPIHQYHLAQRIRTAMEYLWEGWENLTDLAFELGFSGHAHFSDTFRRLTGISPTQYRATRTGIRPVNLVEYLDSAH